MWDYKSGSHSKSLSGHSINTSIFSLESHPTDKRYVSSACQLGRFILWDIIRGFAIFSINLPDPILASAFSPDGFRFSISDLKGNVHLFGIGVDDFYYRETPFHQFHLIDWINVYENEDGLLIDQETEWAADLVDNGQVVSNHRVPYPISEAQISAKTAIYPANRRLIKLNYLKQNIALNYEKNTIFKNENDIKFSFLIIGSLY